MPGLFFIALNRILAPAFYAQSDTKSPTIAGIASFAVNITLAAILVGRYRGAGIAFALSFASVVNTILLLVFLRKNPNIDLRTVIGPALLYILKMIILSAIAIIPVYFLSQWLKPIFANSELMLIAHGIPLIINAAAFFLLGIALLAIVKDENFTGFVRILRKRNKDIDSFIKK